MTDGMRPPTDAELEAERRVWLTDDTERPPPDLDHPLAVRQRRAQLEAETRNWTWRAP